MLHKFIITLRILYTYISPPPLLVQKLWESHIHIYQNHALLLRHWCDLLNAKNKLKSN